MNYFKEASRNDFLKVGDHKNRTDDFLQRHALNVDTENQNNAIN